MFWFVFRYRCYYLILFCIMMFCCTDVIMQLYYQFDDLPLLHRCYLCKALWFLLHRCYSAESMFVYFQFCYFCPLCTDVIVLGFMILIAQMFQCRIIIGLFSVLGWIVITHPIGVAGYISQYFCLMWDCSLWCIWPPLLLLPYCDLLCLLSWSSPQMYIVASAILVFMYGRWCF